jgi:acyl dehydratase
LRVADLTVGQTFELVLVEDLRRTQIVQYAGASGDFNPAHIDEMYAREIAGLPSVFAHGMLTMGMTARVVTDAVGADRLTTFGGRFTAQVWPGDTLTATATISEIREHDGGAVADLDVVTKNQNGVDVFVGRATARLDA